MTPGTDTDHAGRDYLVTPSRPGGGPGVVLLHSGRGLTEFVKQLAGRLGHAGYTTLAVDLFDGETPTTVEDADSLKESLDADATLVRLDDAAGFLRRHDAVTRPHLGVIGLGFGAEWAIRLCERSPGRVGCLVVFYGVTGCDWATLDCAIQGHFAELDHEIPLQSVRSLESQLEDALPRSEVHVYDGAEPSFFEDDPTARYDPEAAALAWERMQSFLDETLR